LTRQTGLGSGINNAASRIARLAAAAPAAGVASFALGYEAHLDRRDLDRRRLYRLNRLDGRRG